MRKISIILSLFIFLGATHARATNALFGYTHVQASPLTIPAGRLYLGTEAGYGVTSFFQVSTNILGDLYKVYNAQAKLGLLDDDLYAFALTFGWDHYNLRDISKLNPDISITSYRPGAVVGFAALDDVAWFGGITTSMTNVKYSTAGLKTSGYVHGTEFGGDFSWAYERGSSPSGRSAASARSKTSRHSGRVGNVLSGGVTYDVTYDLMGLGISHHWNGFHIGVHYYPSATENKYLPIVAGGATVDL